MLENVLDEDLRKNLEGVPPDKTRVVIIRPKTSEEYDRFLSEALKIPVEIGNPFTNILANKGKYLIPDQKALSFTTALGLALRGADIGSINSYNHWIYD